MPYIKEEEREKYRPGIRELVTTLNQEARPYVDRLGPVNYIITSLLNGAFPKRRGYFIMVFVIGTLACVALEFYRRRGAPYEDEKIKANGDVY